MSTRNRAPMIVILLMSGSDTGDSAGVLSQIISDLYRIVLDRNVEVVERDDEQSVKRCISPAAGSEPAEEGPPVAADVEHILDSSRNAQQ